MAASWSLTYTASNDNRFMMNLLGRSDWRGRPPAGGCPGLKRNEGDASGGPRRLAGRRRPTQPFFTPLPGGGVLKQDTPPFLYPPPLAPVLGVVASRRLPHS